MVYSLGKLPDYYKIKINQDMEPLNEKKRSSVIRSNSLSVHKSYEPKDSPRKSILGLNFKSLFENTHTKNKLNRLHSMFKILK